MFFVSSCSCLCQIHWSQVLSWEWRCSWSSADRRCSNYTWLINNYSPRWGAAYIRGLTVLLLGTYAHRSCMLGLLFSGNGFLTSYTIFIYRSMWIIRSNPWCRMSSFNMTKLQTLIHIWLYVSVNLVCSIYLLITRPVNDPQIYGDLCST